MLHQSLSLDSKPVHQLNHPGALNVLDKHD